MKICYLNRIALTLFCALGVLPAWADAPAGYYDACVGKSKSALKSQLYTIIKNHKAISYGTSTWAAFQYTDVVDGSYWWDIYTDEKVNISGHSSMNIEHSFPKSWWGGSSNDAYKDIVHLRPVNGNANNLRSNYPFAEVGTELSYKQQVPSPRFKYGSPKAGQGGGSDKVFEPDDEYKGDMARTYFYMVTCYQNLTWQNNGTMTAAQGTYPTLQPWAQEMLLRWHRMDPVSEQERRRNEGVYSQQGNRNPFIDHPEMVEHIWGELMEQGWQEGGVTPPDPIDPPVDPPADPDVPASLTSPIDADRYDYQPIFAGETASLEIPVLGSSFKRSLVARIEGKDADLFRIAVGKNRFSALTISAADINNKEGYAVSVEYSPTEASADAHEATLTLSGADLNAPVSVTLAGHTREQISVTAPVALPAEDITPEGYTARWMKTAQEVDGYTLYRNIYAADGTTIEHTFTYELDGETDRVVITDRDEDTPESYYVTASIDDTESAPSNVITINAVGLETVAADSSTPTYFTPSGIALPGLPAEPGVYIIRIGSHTLKSVIVK